MFYLSLLVLFPLSWFAPLVRAGLLPLFGLSEISVMTGLQSLWASDVFLALVVTVFALFAPYLKTIGLALLHWNLLSARCLPALHVLGKLAMADVFLIALFTACIFASLWVGLRTKQSGQDTGIASKSETDAADLPQYSPAKIK